MKTIAKKQASILLFPQNYEFVSQEAKDLRTSKTDIINKALFLYRKFKLKKKIQEGFMEQSKEDSELAMSDFGDYFKIINESEACN